jgi:hypothetical protein
MLLVGGAEGGDPARGRGSGRPVVPPGLLAAARGEGRAARGEERGGGFGQRARILSDLVAAARGEERGDEFGEGNGGLGFG